MPPRRLFPGYPDYLDLASDPWFGGQIREEKLAPPPGPPQPGGRATPYAPLRAAPPGPYGDRAVPLRQAPLPFGADRAVPLRVAPDVMPGRPPSLGGGVYSDPTTIASIGGFRTPGMGEPFRTPLTPQGREMARLAEAESGYQRRSPAARPPTASVAPTGTYEGGPGSSGTLGRTASGTHPQDRATGDRPSLADGQAQPGGFLSAINRWATKPLFADGRSEGMLGIQRGEHEGPGGWGGGVPPMTRIGAIGQMLSAAAAGIGATPGGGNWLGAGLAGAAGSLQQATKNEQERRQQAYENEYKRLQMEVERKKLDKPADLIKTSPGDILLDPTTREPVFTAPPKAPDVAGASNPFEAAWRSLPPEQQTVEMAQKLAAEDQARKDAPTAHQQFLEQQSELRYAQQEAAARRAEAAGNRAEATQIRLENETRARAEREQRTAGTNLRKEFDDRPEVQKYRTVLPVIRSAIESAGQDDIISDIDLVYAMGTTLDPGSVVREGEQLTIARSQNLTEQLKGQINAVMGGARLQPAVRQQMLRTLKSRAEGLRKSAEKARNDFAGYVRGLDLDPDAFIPSVEDLPDIAAVPAPEAGRAELAAPAAQGPGAGTAEGPPAANLPKYASPADVDVAVRAGTLKRGDKFKDADGNIRTVP